MQHFQKSLGSSAPDSSAESLALSQASSGAPAATKPTRMTTASDPVVDRLVRYINKSAGQHMRAWRKAHGVPGAR